MEKYILPNNIRNFLLGCIGIGVVTLAAGFVIQPERAWAGLLVITFYILAIGLFGGFFTSFQFLAGAKWSVVVRRLTEVMVALIPVAAVLLIGVFAGIHHLYEWSHEDVVKNDHILSYKQGYLNSPMFIARLVFYVAMWFFLGNLLKKTSIKQDETKDPATRGTLTKYSIFYMLFFVYTFSLASMDLIMSLEPHWQTTMYPVYCFAGLAYSGFGTLILLSSTIKNGGGLKGMSIEHFHDIGKFQFVFTAFWGYVVFAMFMLIWYANMPEETVYLERRLKGNWFGFTFALWGIHFLLPFLILLSSSIKRSPQRLAKVAWLITFMGFVDVVWMVYGGLQHKIQGFPFSWMELGLYVGAVGIIGFIVLTAYAKVGPEPIGDPFYKDSLNFHQSH